MCGAGFGGLELTARLATELGDDVQITLIDRNDSFVFGFSKFDVMFARKTTHEVRHHYADITKPGVDVRQETIIAIDPDARTVTTDAEIHEADLLVVALGADYDIGATPGLAEDGYEFYTVEGAARAGDALRSFEGGRIVIGILGPMFKCPPAPFECAFLVHDHLVERRVRDRSQIHVVSPLPNPIPVAEDTSATIVRALDDRNIAHTFGELIDRLDPATHIATTRNGLEVGYDLFLAIPRHKAPDVVCASGMCVDGWVPVDQTNLRTSYDGVYAVGDVASAPVPRAGVFAENAAATVADDIIARLRGTAPPPPYEGAGSCYIEFGDGLVGKVDANFLGGPKPQAPLLGPSVEYAEEKKLFASTRHDRWFS